MYESIYPCLDDIRLPSNPLSFPPVWSLIQPSPTKPSTSAMNAHPEQVTAVINNHGADKPTIPLSSTKAPRDCQADDEDIEHDWRFGSKSYIHSLKKSQLYKMLKSKSPNTHIALTDLKATIFQEIQCLVRASMCSALRPLTLSFAAQGGGAN